jgi:hypothetical protein
MDSNTKALLDRIEQLEAEVTVHREFIRTLVSFAPDSREHSGALRMAEDRARKSAAGRPQSEAVVLDQAIGRVNAFGVTRLRTDR